MNDRIRRALWRFLRGFIAGAVSTMTLISVANINTWSDVGALINAWAIAAIVGGGSGLIQAIDKYFRDGAEERK